MYAQVVEYGPPVELPLSPEQVSTLVAANAHWQRSLRLPRAPFQIDTTTSGAILSARDVAGFVRAGDVSLDIIPKFLAPEELGPQWRVCLWRLLAFASGIDSIPVPTVGVESEEFGIADLLADMFLKSIKSSTQLGLPLGYREERELSPFLKGRLDGRRLGRLAYADGFIPVKSRRLTRDTDNGRLLRWASIELANMVDSKERRKSLRSWASTLPEVKPTPPNRFHSHLVARQFPHLAEAFQVAEMLLADRWGDFGQGSLKLPGFIWKSEALFEKSMLRLLQRSARELGLSAEKRPHLLATDSSADHGGPMVTTPDITVFKAGHPITVLDAKYKVLSGYPSNSDIYQVLSGGRVAAASRVALVYPSATSGLTVRRLLPGGSGLPISIDLVSVGLASFGSPQALRNLTQELTNWLLASSSFE